MMSTKERFEARSFGYRLRAFYINPYGVPFHKDFRDDNELEIFNRKAEDVGTTFTGYISI